MNKTVLIGVIFVVAVLAFLMYSSMHIAQYRVEVCVAFRGQSSCRTASADSQDHALRSAQTNACALLVSGPSSAISPSTAQHRRPRPMIDSERSAAFIECGLAL